MSCREAVRWKEAGEAHRMSLALAMLIESQGGDGPSMMLTYGYRLSPKRQHRALEAILESQRQLYNAALAERIDAYRKAKVTRT